jgi:signal transduction histidine kinase
MSKSPGMRWRVACLLTLLACGLLARAAEPAVPALPVVHYTQVEVTQVDMPVSRSMAELVAKGNAQRPPPEGAAPAWRSISLPELSPRNAAVGDVKPAVSAMRWYRLRYSRPGPPPDGSSTALGLYIPRMVTGPLSILMREGSGWRVLYQSNERWREEWNRPVLTELPPEAGPEIELMVGCSGVVERGLHVASTMWVGPIGELRWRANWRQLLQLQAPLVTSLVIAFVGVFALAVWWRRRHEQAYLFFGLAAAVWVFRNLHYYIDLPRQPALSHWFWWATHASLSWLMLLIYCFALRFDSRHHPRVERALWGGVLLCSLLTLPLWSLPLDALVDSLLVQHLVNAAASVAVTVYLSLLCLRGGPELRAITLACWVSLAFGINDLQLLAGKINPETIYLLPYSPLVVFASFFYATWRRYVQAIAQVESANSLLELRLQEREAQLQANHARLRTVEREQALLLERQRLMADMHDGIGSTLMSSLMMLEQGQLDSQGAAGVVRECVDDLRLVIDSLEPVDNDLGSLLATLRHRLGRRMEAAGVQLHWHMGELPPLTWLSAPDALQVLRLVQEVLTNVLKHAAARSVQMSAACTDGGEVEVRVADDGRGFDTSAPTSIGGRGMGNLRLRARQLQARLEVISTPGQGTVVRLVLPLRRQDRPLAA